MPCVSPATGRVTVAELWRLAGPWGFPLGGHDLITHAANYPEEQRARGDRDQDDGRAGDERASLSSARRQ